MRRFCAARAVLATVGVFLALTAASPALADAVKANVFGGRTYYHLTLELTRDRLVEIGAIGDPDLEYRFSDGGQFEVYLQGDLPGVAAPGCQGVTLRMPWTDPRSDGADEKIAGKRALFDRIQSLVRWHEIDSLDVVVELNPYVEQAPDGSLRLTQCLAFFRQAFGAYVAHDGPLSDK